MVLMSGKISCNATGGIGHELHEFIIFHTTTNDHKEAITLLQAADPKLARSLAKHIPFVYAFRSETDVAINSEGQAKYLHDE